MIKRLINRLTTRKRARVSKPVFIIGCARSGTTLLFELLSSNSKLIATDGYPDGEDHVGWIEHGKAIISGLGSPNIDRGRTGYHYCLPMNEIDADPSVRAAMHDYYIQHVLRGSVRQRVLNKCPHLSNKLRYVREIFPDAKFVHIVRDYVAVVSSLRRMMEEQSQQLLYWPGADDACLWILPAPKDIDRTTAFRNNKSIYPGGGTIALADYWNRTNLNIVAQLADTPDQLLTVRYEDLCGDPGTTLREICDFCELPRFREIPKAKFNRPIESNLNEKHIREFGDQVAARLRAQSAKACDAFGYTPR